MLPTTRKMQQNWLPSIFTDFIFDDNFGISKVKQTTPAINVIEVEDSYRVEVAAPGMSKEDFKIRVNDENNLIISLEKREEKGEEERKDEKYLRREFSYTKFEQALFLPEDIDLDNINASMNSGVLKVSLPKLKNIPEPKKERLISIR